MPQWRIRSRGSQDIREQAGRAEVADSAVDRGLMELPAAKANQAVPPAAKVNPAVHRAAKVNLEELPAVEAKQGTPQAAKASPETVPVGKA